MVSSEGACAAYFRFRGPTAESNRKTEIQTHDSHGKTADYAD